MGATEGDLPKPPSDRQKFAYVKRHVWLLQLFTICSFAAVAYSTARFSLVSDDLTVIVVPLAIAAVAFATSLRINLPTRDFDDERHRRLVAAWASRPDDEYPSVDVFLPICGEDRRVLVNTWKHVRALDYPHVTVYCLDDSADGAMQPVAEGYGFRYLRRGDRGRLKKAGNLQYGYEHSCGDFVLILDADFAPRPDFLRETLPYFDADPGVGIVQTPQYFTTTRRQRWLERGAGAVQEYFYRVAQVSRDRYDASICVGTCAVYRRAALDSNGGTTQIEHSEDVHTGFDLRRHGWRLRYLPVNLAAGLCPGEISSFFRQQYRWCLGSMTLCTSRKFWSTKMALTTRLCYATGFLYYVLTALAVITVPLIPLTLTIVFPRHVHLENYVVLLPAFAWMYVVMPRWHRCRFRLETLSVKLTYGWAHAFALFDIVRRRPMGWTPTGAKARDRRVLWFRVGAAVWGGGTAALLVAACLWQVVGRGYPVEHFAPMLIFAGIYSMTNARVILHGAARRSGAWLNSALRARRAQAAEGHELLPLVGGRAPSTLCISQASNDALAGSLHTVAVAATDRGGRLHLALTACSAPPEVTAAGSRALTGGSYRRHVCTATANAVAAITGAAGDTRGPGDGDGGWSMRRLDACRHRAGGGDRPTSRSSTTGWLAATRPRGGSAGGRGRGVRGGRAPYERRRDATHGRATVRFGAAGDATEFHRTRVRTQTLTGADRRRAHPPRTAPRSMARDREPGGAAPRPPAHTPMAPGLASAWWLLAVLVMGACGGAGWRLRMQRRASP